MATNEVKVTGVTGGKQVIDPEKFQLFLAKLKEDVDEAERTADFDEMVYQALIGAGFGKVQSATGLNGYQFFTKVHSAALKGKKVGTFGLIGPTWSLYLTEEQKKEWSEAAKTGVAPAFEITPEVASAVQALKEKAKTETQVTPVTPSAPVTVPVTIPTAPVSTSPSTPVDIPVPMNVDAKIPAKPKAGVTKPKKAT